VPPFVETTRSVEETLALGARLGAALRTGDFVALEGELGAGKTRLVEGIARGFGVDPARRIPSPTFTLVNEHPGRGLLIHADLYRLAGAEELYELGWREYLSGSALVVVEWLSRVGRTIEVAPVDRLDVTIEIVGGDTREVSFEASGDRSDVVLRMLTEHSAP
jgi:tRNA threonylcarbamoyladenosine biosynthesis protein TsaE